jgi:phosphogluconate dehydratase
MIELDVVNGSLHVLVDEKEWAARPLKRCDDSATFGMGRELFALQRRYVSAPEQGANTLFSYV